MSARDTAKASRYAAAEFESREFKRGLHETGVSQADVAVALGRAHSRVSRWAEERFRELPNAADIACFPPKLREWYARRDAARLGQHLYDIPQLKAQSDHLMLLAEHARESAELMAAHSDALRDGVITPDEYRRIRAEAIDAMNSAVRTIATCDEGLFTKGIH